MVAPPHPARRLSAACVSLVAAPARAGPHLEPSGLLGALISPLFRLPLTWTFRATLGGPEPVEGILEISAFEE